MRLFRKLVAFVVYGALLFPGTDSFRLNAWMRAVSVTSTAFDGTLRRRRSRLENDRFARHLKMLQMDVQHEERTLRTRLFGR
jgi:hypothetical protein